MGRNGIPCMMIAPFVILFFVFSGMHGGIFLHGRWFPFFGSFWMILGMFWLCMWAFRAAMSSGTSWGGPGSSDQARAVDYRLPGMICVAVGIVYPICVAVSSGLYEGAERAVSVGAWGLIPLAVGVVMYRYGGMVRREQAGPGREGRRA